MVIAVCDDNKEYLEYISKQVEPTASFSHQNVIIMSYAPETLWNHISNNHCPFNILIIDIEMGDFNGIEIAKKINKITSSCFIIFLSNYLNYATSVYDAEHVYFVLKSEASLMLPKAVLKAITMYQKIQNNFLNISYLNTNYKISIHEITHIESYGRYLQINTLRSAYQCIDTLKNVSQNLLHDFIQIHKSYIINMNHISSINRTNCVLCTGISLPISYTYSKKVQESYINFVSNKINAR